VEDVVDLLEGGVTGYLARESSVDELMIAILRSLKGEFVCTDAIARDQTKLDLSVQA